MTDTGGRSADWYPDPWGRHESRYFDGAQWTAHVASHGKEATDPPGGALGVDTALKQDSRGLG